MDNKTSYDPMIQHVIDTIPELIGNYELADARKLLAGIENEMKNQFPWEYWKLKDMILVAEYGSSYLLLPEDRCFLENCVDNDLPWAANILADKLILLGSKKDLKKALPYLTIYLESMENHKEEISKTLATIGVIYDQLKKQKKAIEYLTESGNPYALRMLGHIYVHKRDLNNAVEWFEKAAEAGDEDAYGHAADALLKSHTASNREKSYIYALKYLESPDGTSSYKQKIYSRQLKHWKRAAMFSTGSKHILYTEMHQRIKQLIPCIDMTG